VLLVFRHQSIDSRSSLLQQLDAIGHGPAIDDYILTKEDYQMDELARLDQTESLTNLNTAAKIRIVTQTLVSAIPYAGSPLITFYQSKQAEIFQQRVTDFLHALKIRVEELERGSLLKTDFLQTQEFAEMFDEVANKVGVERQQAKRNLLAYILCHAAEVPDDQRRWFPTALQLLDRVEIAHVKILGLAQDWRNRGEQSEMAAGHVEFTSSQALWVVWPEEYTDFARQHGYVAGYEARTAARKKEVVAMLYYLISLGLLRESGEDFAITDLGSLFLEWIVARDVSEHPFQGESFSRALSRLG
jgi:hypothetical protein